MTEAAERGREVWIEKYRPQTLEDVAGHENITSRLRSYVERDDLPHLLFAGPAGVGKCVTGETPVLTNQGIERIENVVGDVDGFGPPDDELKVLTFDERGDFEYVEPSHVYGKRADDLVTVTTRDGNELTVTPEHKMLTVGEDGLSWTPAGDLDAGDRVVRPLRTPLPDGDGELDWVTALDGERTFVHVTESFAKEHGIPAAENFVGTKKSVVSGLEDGLSPSDIAEQVGTSRKTVQAYRRQVDEQDLDAPSTVCSLSYLRDLDVSREQLREHITHVQWVTAFNKRSRPITPAWEVTPELARFVGLAISEAKIENGRVKFYNTGERLLEQFEAAAMSVFGLEPKFGEQNDVPYRECNTKTITHFVKSCFGVFGDGGVGGIGTAIATADEESRCAFLRAVFDSEAYVSENGHLELMQKDEELITLVAYLLSGVGVPSRRKTVEKSATNGPGAGRKYHALYVSGASHLSRFEEAVGFTIPEKASRLAACAARNGNPNADTVPTQATVDVLCEQLYLQKGDMVPESLNPDSPGRPSYLDAVERVLDAATEKLDTAQDILERIDSLEREIDDLAAIPARWVGEHSELEPLSQRKAISETSGVRTDRLLEYADGCRSPGAERAGAILVDLDAIEEQPATEGTQAELVDCIESLGVPYNHVAVGTEMRGAGVINLLDGGTDLGSMARFETVAEEVRDVAAGMLTSEVFGAIQRLDVLASADLYFDEVTDVEAVEEPKRVYDLTVPGTRNYVAGGVPTVMHNTTCAVAVAKELYGDDWRENFLELNASDQRGIDVVRDRIKNFARSSFGGYNYRVIFLDEADALTSDAQSALRRTMEQFSNNTRFILSCNYSSQIIDPIQSRCAVFRFSPLGDDAVAAEVREIADVEGIEVTDDGVDALVYAAAGDMRKAINGLQAAAVMGETVDEEAVYAITSTARPEEIEEMVTLALEGDFTQARSRLDELLTDVGIAGGDVIDQLHRSVWEFDLSDREAVRLMDRIGEADYRITTGANEQIQLEALLASLALEEDGEAA